jgi:hypothetical protein
MQKIYTIWLLLFSIYVWGQAEEEVNPPYHIKSVAFQQNGQNVVPFFKLGDPFQLVFDDLYGDESNYYYTITHCNYNWTKSVLMINEYLNGLDNQLIIDYENSFNTLQTYSHYRLTFPNRFTKALKVSGNYVLKIFNSKQELVFSRKFIVYEDLVNVPLQVRVPREVVLMDRKHNLDFSITPRNIVFQDPIKNVQVAIYQNGIWETEIRNIKPMFTTGNSLIYRYDKETQYWAGNEFLFFDNKDIRNAANNVRRISATKDGLYNTFLFTSQPRANQPYTFFPDVNGNFQPRNINTRENDNTEADYSWVYFSLNAPLIDSKSKVFITGMFNNYARSAEFEMEYNAKTGLFEKALMMKQGFTNFQYTVVDKKGKIDWENAMDGNFFQTENNYSIFVYYRANNDRFDRVIGKGSASSVDIIR